MSKSRRRSGRKRVERWNASLLIVSTLIVGIVLVLALLVGQHFWQQSRHIQSQEGWAPVLPTSTPAYLYYVLKGQTGFTLARAHRGTDNQPTDAPSVICSSNLVH